MCENSNVSLAFNIYEPEGEAGLTIDLSFQELEDIPKLDSKLLCVIYLQHNKLQQLPEDFFDSLPCLVWLDLRNNELSNIPKSVKNHQNMTHLLLQNNNVSCLPNELGTVFGLKVLQLSGNPLLYPPRDIVCAGIKNILSFLHKNYIKELFARSGSASEDGNISGSHITVSPENNIKNFKSPISNRLRKAKTFSVQVSEKDVIDSDDKVYSKSKGKCPKLALSRKKTLPSFWQSSKYLKPVHVYSKDEQDEKIKQSLLREMALTKRKNQLASRDKMLQDKRNIELLKNWRESYSYRKICMSREGSSFTRCAKDYPYDTDAQYMSLLTREDIEKDLPDKYKKRLWRRCKLAVPRKSNNDVHLAMRIKQLFENLEAIDLNRGDMTPRTEQKVLLSEIHKISEIKQKLTELSATNSRSAAPQ